MKTERSSENSVDFPLTPMERITSYAYPIAGALGIAAYIVSQLLD